MMGLGWSKAQIASFKRFKPPIRAPSATKRMQAGFTLAEVLAALAFMAIVIPVAVQGLRVASLAGQVGQRKAVAGRIAERVLNELTVTGQSQGTARSGVAQDGALFYRWTVRAEPWSEAA